MATIDKKLAQLRNASQKDKAQAYISLLEESISQKDSSRVSRDIHSLMQEVLSQDQVPIIVGRQVLTELAKTLSEDVVKDSDTKMDIIKDTLAIAQPRLVSYEEQVRIKSRLFGWIRCIQETDYYRPNRSIL